MKITNLKDHKDNMTPEQKCEKAYLYAQRGIKEVERRIELAKRELELLKELREISKDD